MSNLADDDLEGEVEDEMEEQEEDEEEEEIAPGNDERITFNCKRVSWEDATKRGIKAIEAGTGLWKCTNMTKTGATFQLSCATCHKEFSPNNPANFWRTHKKQCTPDVRGQVLEPGAPLLPRNSCWVPCLIDQACILRTLCCPAPVAGAIADMMVLLCRQLRC